MLNLWPAHGIPDSPAAEVEIQLTGTKTLTEVDFRP